MGQIINILIFVCLMFEHNTPTTQQLTQWQHGPTTSCVIACEEPKTHFKTEINSINKFRCDFSTLTFPDYSPMTITTDITQAAELKQK